MATPPLVSRAGILGRRRRQVPRRLTALTKRDKIVLAVMLGIPTLIHIAFVWVPALSSIGLSFTSWEGIGGFDTIKWRGTQNYEDIFSISRSIRRSGRRSATT